MTDHDHTTGDQHLDDEALSAVLDGEATAEESAHADRCAACTTRLGELRDASLLVRTPVPVADDAARDAAVGVALAATEQATVTPLRRRTVPAWLAAAAAVIVIAFGVVALTGRGDDDQTTAASKADDSGGLDVSTTVAAPFTQAVAAPIDGGDLGDVEAADLRATIDDALASAPQRDAADFAAPTAGGATSESAGSAATAAPACEETVRGGFPELGPLVYRATGTFEGDPVAVLAFDVTGADDAVHRWVYVVSADSCEIRNQTTYAVTAEP